MTNAAIRQAAGISVREARSDDLAAVRALMVRVLDEDYGYGMRPDLHGDIANLQGYYLDNPRHTLLVAMDGGTGDVIGAVAVRAAALPEHGRPRWLVERYDGVTSAEICRLSVAAERRRRGAGRALVEAARRWVAREGGYRVIQLHTNARPENAGPFWFSAPATVVWDGRAQEGYRPMYRPMVHFELPIPALDAEEAGTGEDP